MVLVPVLLKVIKHMIKNVKQKHINRLVIGHFAR